MTSPKHVLVTGAAGRIGSYFAAHNNGKYTLRLLVKGDEDAIDGLRQYGEVMQADIADLAALKPHCAGIHTIIHMAGVPNPSAVWEDLLSANIVGTYNVFAAAKAAGVTRVIYASSIHAVSGYAPRHSGENNRSCQPRRPVWRLQVLRAKR